MWQKRKSFLLSISHICSLYPQLPVKPTSFIYRAATSPDQTWLIAAICSHSCSSSPIKPLYEAAKWLLPLPTAAVSFLFPLCAFLVYSQLASDCLLLNKDEPKLLPALIRLLPVALQCFLVSSSLGLTWWFGGEKSRKQVLLLCESLLIHWSSACNCQSACTLSPNWYAFLFSHWFSVCDLVDMWPLLSNLFCRVKTLRMFLSKLSWVQSCSAKSRVISVTDPKSDLADGRCDI